MSHVGSEDLLDWIAACLACSPAKAETSFVFVHGAFVGEWYWDPIVDALLEDGYTAYAVTLRGYGQRADENSSKLTAYDHGQDIVDLVASEMLDEIILVAHSYGGLPATVALDQLRSKVNHAIYIDAFAPFSKTEVAIPEQSAALETLRKDQPEILQNGLTPVPDYLLEKYEGLPLAPQSVAASYGAIELKNGPLENIAGTYLLAGRSGIPLFRQIGLAMERNHGWTLLAINSGHDVVGDNAEDLVAFLKTFAQP